MGKRLCIAALMCMITVSLFAQVPDTLLNAPPDDLNLNANLDSMLHLWYVDKYRDADQWSEIDSLEADSIHTTIPDSVYIARLARIPSVVDLTYNPIVRRYIEVYTVKRRASVENMLGLAEYYFPIFDEVFDAYGVPNEMKYMTIIESALNPRAYSRARAVGLWQFMYGTAKLNGLTINSFVDERLDPIKESEAAARYVKELYGIYQDWTLVIAAYNCGPVNVNKAIRRSGGKKNYWEIYYHLPRQTRGHIPAFIAAAYVMNYYKEHKLVPHKCDLPIPSDTIMVAERLHLKQVSEVLGIPLQELRDMNPQYIRDIIPGEPDRPYALALPMSYSMKFIDLEDSIYHYKDSMFFSQNMLAQPVYSRRGYAPGPPPGNSGTVYYTVKSGDNLGFISQWFHVSIGRLQDWNDLYRTRIREGQKLVIYVPKSKVSYYKSFNTMSFAEKQKSIGASGDKLNTPGAAFTEGQDEYYTVKDGDTLWDIAKKFPGVTGSDIMELNNLSNPSKIVPGQKLRIRKRSS